MARHEKQPDKADGQTNSVRKPRTFSSTATVETSKPDNSVNITNRNGKPETDASGGFLSNKHQRSIPNRHIARRARWRHLGT